MLWIERYIMATGASFNEGGGRLLPAWFIKYLILLFIRYDINKVDSCIIHLMIYMKSWEGTYLLNSIPRSWWNDTIQVTG